MSYGYPGPGGQQQPPPHQPQWGRPPAGWGGPPPSRKSNAGKIIGFSLLGIGLVFVLIIGLALAVSGGDSGSAKGGSAAVADDATVAESSDSPEATAAGVPDGPKGDVKVTGCKVDATTSWPAAELLVTNRSSKTSNYLISVEFVDGSGKRLGEAFSSVNNLAAGQQAEETAQGLDTITSKIKCRVTEVTRYAS